MNARVLKIIRKTNPVRLVVFSGHEWSAAEQLLSAAIPDTSDKYLVGYFHSYDPWPFGLQGPGTYGSSADIYATKSRFDKVAAWSVKNNIPVILSEFGAIKKCEYNSRMYCYATVVEQSINHGVAFNAWDDGGDFQIMLRPSRKWNDIKDILMYTYKESPTKLKLVLVKNTNIMFTWTNRTNLNDSIIIDRKTSSTSAFTKIATVAPGASSYYDSLLTPNKDYYYRLRSNIKDSIQIYSYPITIKTNLSTSINTFENRGVFLIYPNPANSRISIKSSNAAPNTTLEVYDILGKLTTRLSIHGNEAEIPLTSYNPGVYFFRLSNNSGTEIYKVILQ